MPVNVNNLIKRAELAFGSDERINADTMWAAIAARFLPQQSGIFTAGQIQAGSKKTSKMLDSIPPQACQDLASYISASLTNPATIWSNLAFRSPELSNNTEASMWLDECNDKIFKEFNESNFYTEMGKAWLQLVVFGTCNLLQEEKVKYKSKDWNGFRFKSLHLAELAFEENYDGIVDRIYIRRKLKPNQVVDRWGPGALEGKALKMLEREPNAEIEFITCIYPRSPEEVKINSLGFAKPEQRPFAAYTVCKLDNSIIQSDGYYEFPCHVARWSTMPSETYGSGPAHMAYPDVVSLYRTRELTFASAGLALQPPMLAVHKSLLSNLDLRPAGLTIVRGSVENIKQFETHARFDVSQMTTEDFRNSIKSVFYLDKLMLPPRTETGEMTAYEVSERLSQMQRVLGPVLNRLNTEMLQPLITNSFKTLLRRGQLPPMPEVIKKLDFDIDINYVNPLARSQKMEEASNIQGWVQEVALLAQLKPEVIDYINADYIVQHVADIRGIPQNAITNDQDVEEARQQRQQQQQVQSAVGMGIGIADINSKMGGNNSGQ